MGSEEWESVVPGPFESSEACDCFDSVCRNFLSHDGGNAMQYLAPQHANATVVSVSESMEEFLHLGGVETFIKKLRLRLKVASSRL